MLFMSHALFSSWITYYFNVFEKNLNIFFKKMG